MLCQCTLDPAISIFRQAAKNTTRYNTTVSSRSPKSSKTAHIRLTKMKQCLPLPLPPLLLHLRYISAIVTRRSLTGSNSIQCRRRLTRRRRPSTSRPRTKSRCIGSTTSSAPSTVKSACTLGVEARDHHVWFRCLRERREHVFVLAGGHGCWVAGAIGT